MTAIYEAEATPGKSQAPRGTITSKVNTPFLEREASSELSCGTECAREPLGKAGPPRQLMQTQLGALVENGLSAAIAGPASQQSLAL